MNRLQEVTALLEQALSGISYERLDISDEIQEQVSAILVGYNLLLDTSLRLFGTLKYLWQKSERKPVYVSPSLLLGGSEVESV